MTQEHMKKIIEYVTIKEKVTYEQLCRFSEHDRIDNRFYTGALEEWHAYSTVLDVLQDEKQLDRLLAIWKE